MEERQEVHEILDSVDQNTEEATSIIMKRERHKHLIRWLVETALVHIKAQARAQRRRQLRREIEPGYQVMFKGSNRLELTESAKERLKAATKKLFGRDGWQIGNVQTARYTFLCHDSFTQFDTNQFMQTRSRITLQIIQVQLVH